MRRNDTVIIHNHRLLLRLQRAMAVVVAVGVMQAVVDWPISIGIWVVAETAGGEAAATEKVADGHGAQAEEADGEEEVERMQVEMTTTAAMNNNNIEDGNSRRHGEEEDNNNNNEEEIGIINSRQRRPHPPLGKHLRSSKRRLHHRQRKQHRIPMAVEA